MNICTFWEPMPLVHKTDVHTEEKFQAYMYTQMQKKSMCKFYFGQFLPVAFRRNGEDTVFTGVCLHRGVPPSSWQGKGTPIQPMGGYPHPADRGGTPIQMLGVSHLADGVTLARLVWGTPSTLRQDRMEVPPPPFQQTGPAPTRKMKQHSEYVMCGRRYASCIYTGGLSC